MTRRFLSLLAAFCFVSLSTARASVFVADASGTSSAAGSAVPVVGGLDCDTWLENGPKQFATAKACLQNYGRRCRVWGATGWSRFTHATGDEVLPWSTFGIESSAGAKAMEETCYPDVTNVHASASAGFSAEISLDVPTRVRVFGLTNGGSASLNLPGGSIPQNQSFDFSVLVDPPGFTISGGGSASASSSSMMMDEDIEAVNLGFEFTEPPPRRPLVLVPGIGGTYAANLADDGPWLLSRGIGPGATQVDPLAGAYDDLLQTLRNVGYVDGKDLFVVKYDWRLPPGPSDGSFDGVIAGITAPSISDTNFTYAVDYLGLVLREATERWALDHNGEALDVVDVVAHSTGGLVTRAYLQSPAYKGAVNPTLTLPGVRNFFLVGVPNRGASKAWNALQNNWIADPAYVLVLSKILDRVYQKLPNGALVSGPQTISQTSILDPGTGQPDPIRFIHQYVPTVRSLLATYDFLDLGGGLQHVNGDPAVRNDVLLDLNAGFDLQPTADPVPFASLCDATVIYGTNVATPTTVTRRVGPRGNGLSIAAFSDFIPRAPIAGEQWFEDRMAPLNGDGTVPIDSSAGLFFGDPRVTLAGFTQGGNTSGSVSHLALMFNHDVQKLILDTLGAAYRPSDISTSLHQSDAESLWSGRSIINTAALVALLDPVDGFVRDGAGRRLGFTAATGALTEIPGSRWIGAGDGFGFALGGFTAPLEFVVAGLGEGHYAGMGALAKSGIGQVIDAGLLANGESRTTPAVLTPLGPECDNGFDDDADGSTDLDDPGCANAADDSEMRIDPRCNAGVDTDSDGIDDACDNCLDVSNWDQLDRGGLGVGNTPDGIGDACQCGDVSGDGRITVADAVIITRSLLTPPTATPARPDLCDVGGSPSPATQNCSMSDAVIIRRALLSPPTATIQPVCVPGDGSQTNF